MDVVRLKGFNSSKDKKKESFWVIIFFSSFKVTDLAKSSITTSWQPPAYINGFKSSKALIPLYFLNLS